MTGVWEVLLGVAAAVLVLWCALCAALWIGYRRDPGALSGAEALRVLPDLLRLLRRLAADRSLPIAVRAGPLVLLLYLLCPIDLVPDFVPVLGQADDVLAVALVLRAVVRRAGPGPLERHWPGTPAGLAAVRRLAGC